MSDDILADHQAARIMEPIYRMNKVVQQKDEDDARTLLALCVQYITENSVGQCLSDAPGAVYRAQGALVPQEWLLLRRLYLQ